MSGRPIPGPHWVALTWPGHTVAAITRVVIDYEVASCTDYAITLTGSATSALIHDSSDKGGTNVVEDKKNKVVMHDIVIKRGVEGRFDGIRLDLRRPGTQWGTSIWELKIYGTLTLDK